MNILINMVFLENLPTTAACAELTCEKRLCIKMDDVRRKHRRESDLDV